MTLETITTNTVDPNGELKDRKEVVEISNCRACGSNNLKNIFDLGEIQVARFNGNDGNGIKAPLTFCWCGDCTYLQLRHNIDTGLVFYPEYGYESGVNPAMIKELGEIAKSASSIVKLETRDIFLDIASNDGTLLLQTEGDIRRVGFDPSRGVAMRGAANLLEKFSTKDFNIFIDYFNKRTWDVNFPGQKAKIMTAIAVFYSVQNPNAFLSDAKSVLDDNGIFVVQQNYTPEMIRQLAFCNAVHEHVTYPTFAAFNSLAERNGFEAADVIINNINGGSFRVYLKHIGSDVNVDGGRQRVLDLLEKEKNEGFMNESVYTNFAERAITKGFEVKKYIQSQVNEGKKVYGLAASTRGNTRLQVWGLGPDLISGIAERNEHKIGKKTLGIPIVSDEEALKNADILFVSIWFYGDSVIDQYKDFLMNGGKMLFPSSPNGEPYLVEIVNGKIEKSLIPTYR